MTFAVDGGIEWEKDTTTKTLTIRPASSPKSGYTSGQMGNFMLLGPWGSITTTRYTLVIESGVTNIGNRAFSSCTGFTGSLTLPSGLTNIGEYAFYDCTGFTGSLTLPSGLTSIDDYAFFGCDGFTGSLTLPSGLTSIGANAFANCSEFADIRFFGDQPTLDTNAFDLQALSPERTYDVYSNGWATSSTFPEYRYTKWRFNPLPSSDGKMWRNVAGTWKKGVMWKNIGGTWKKGKMWRNVGGTWKVGK